MADHNKEDKRLFLLDAFALIYRAYFAFSRNPIVNSKGVNTSAIFGFTNTLLELLNKEKPTHIAVVFDSLERETDRALEHDFYKANREKMPEDIADSIPVIKKLLEGFRIPILEEAGYEADDVIGTLAKKAEKDGYTTYMVTPDKDFGQLVTDKIFMYKPSYQNKPREILGVKEVCSKWDIEKTEQVIDVLGMSGDSIDNIPGIPGVGPKTASKLLKEYGNLESILENADRLKGKLKEKVKENEEQARISKHLATILTNAPVEVDEEALVISEPDKDLLQSLFSELEFRNLGKRVFGEEFSVNQNTQLNLFEDKASASVEEMEFGKNIENTDHHYRLVESEQAINQLIEKLQNAETFVFDTETSGLDPLTCELVGLAFSTKKHEADYLPVPANQEKALELLQKFSGVFKNPHTLKIAHNLKYDLLVLKRYGIDLKSPIYDTMIAHYLIEPDSRHKMDRLAEDYLGYSPVPIEDLIGKKGKQQGNMRDVEISKAAEYAGEDADITLQLKEKLDHLLEERKVKEVFEEIELPLIPVLSNMEIEGVALDREFLANYSKEMAKEIEDLQQAVFEEAGLEFNLDSPKQLGQVLFDKMGIPYTRKKTKSGQYSTNEEVLSSLASEHNIADKILTYRELVKLKSTYVDALPRLINEKTGRVHSSFNQAVAATGRLSSQSPNLQNIPIRTEKGRKIRRAFIARGNSYTLLAADYSQIELRLVASISEDESMINAFRDGLDIHAATASKVYGVKLEEVDKTMRRNAKTVNFGIVYGISAFGLSQRLGIPRKEAKALIDNYFEQYPGIKRYMESSIEFARENGYVKTLKGRRRYLKDINSRNATVRGYAERNAINSPIQGSAADMIKIAMIDIFNELDRRSLKSKMTLQVHDELVFDTHEDELEEVKHIVEDKMKNALQLNVPVIVDMGTGKNWLDAH